MALVATSTVAFGASVLEGPKDLGLTVPSLFRFGFQDDDEPELNDVTTLLEQVQIPRHHYL